ncbi:MAG: hypothetical protein R3C55_15855 [Parvularculaceae bacterium]
MKPLRRRVREVNWKNACDNYVDALHIRVAHDGLNGLLGESYTLTIDRDVHKIFSNVQPTKMAKVSNAAYRKILPCRSPAGRAPADVDLLQALAEPDVRRLRRSGRLHAIHSADADELHPAGKRLRPSG